jgi:uncharacterized DUF497 family protein
VTFEWDEAKAAANLALHGVAFDAARDLDWSSSVVLADDRRDYGEDRFIALGLIAARVHVCVYTVRAGHIRIISLRKANRRETMFYKETNDGTQGGNS